jgi:hypothetical protein
MTLSKRGIGRDWRSGCTKHMKQMVKFTSWRAPQNFKINGKGGEGQREFLGSGHSIY